MDIFEKIRHSCAYVADNADHVRMNDHRLADFAARIPSLIKTMHDSQIPDPARMFYDSAEKTVRLICLLNAANFGSGFRDALRAEKSLPKDKRFYMAIMGRFAEFIRQNGLPDCDALLQGDITYYGVLFGLSADKPVAAEFLQLLQSSCQDYARHLKKDYAGDAWRLYKEANGSAGRIVEYFTSIPSYQDTAMYKGVEVCFYKRAQITAADIYFAFKNQGVDQEARQRASSEIQEIHQLTAFADCALPQILRHLGIIELSSSLETSLLKNEELPAGSTEEVELRAVSLHAFECLRKQMAKMGRMVLNVAEIDHIVWRMAGNKGLSSLPRHKTRTIFY